MPQRCFKLRLSRVIPSFNLCRSKNQSDLPINPSPPFPRPIQGSGQPAPARRSRIVSSTVCGCRGLCVTDPDEFAWREDDTWHVVAKVRGHESPPRRKVYTSAASGCDTDGDLVSTPTTEVKQGRRRRKKKKKKIKVRISSSSVDTCALFFSTDDENVGEETEPLISPSLTLSTSSDQKQSIKTHHTHFRRRRNRESQQLTRTSSTSPSRLSEFQKLMLGRRVEGKMRESLAVVKRSEDPYEDFKSSMMEMILEKEMFDAAELQELLECFLSLNSKHHYATIVGAFSEVWETLFSES